MESIINLNFIEESGKGLKQPFVRETESRWPDPAAAAAVTGTGLHPTALIYSLSCSAANAAVCTKLHGTLLQALHIVRVPHWIFGKPGCTILHCYAIVVSVQNHTAPNWVTALCVSPHWGALQLFYTHTEICCILLCCCCSAIDCAPKTWKSFIWFQGNDQIYIDFSDRHFLDCLVKTRKPLRLTVRAAESIKLSRCTLQNPNNKAKSNHNTEEG